MNVFEYWYEKVLKWARDPRAVRYLAAVSFTDASFFPISPVFMLGPMSLSKPNQAFYYALVATLASGLGGVFGYLLGLFFEPYLHPIILQFGYEQTYQSAITWLNQKGFWAVLAAGFTPIPYKIFTISAGVVKLNFMLFILASVLGRGLRFVLIAGVIKWGGEKMDHLLRRYINKLSYCILGLGFIIVIYNLV